MSSVYLVDGSTLFEARLDGTSRRVLQECGESVALARLHGDVLNLEGNTVYYIHADDGTYAPISRGWQGDGLLAATASRLFLLERGVLVELNDDDTYEVIGRDFRGATHMCALGERLFVLEDGTVEEVLIEERSWRIVRQELREVTAMACAFGRVCVAQADGDILAIDPDTGELDRISDAWPNTQAMAGLGDALVVLGGGALSLLDARGEFEVISRDWLNVKSMTTS